MSNLKHRSLLIVLGVFSLLVPIVLGFTIDGPTVFQGPGGGNVTFASIFVSRQMNTVNGFYLFTSGTFGGTATGSTGFDCDAGDVMVVTDITTNSLTYTISGPGFQRIYFQGFGVPNDVSGGIVTVGAGNSLRVLTTGAGTVVMSWNLEMNNLINSLFGYLAIAVMIPLSLAAYGIRGVMEGTIEQDNFLKLIGGVVFIVITIFITALLLDYFRLVV